MASLLERPLLWANDDFEIRHAKNNEEFHGLWWGFMQDLGWNRGWYDLDSYMNPSLGDGMILLIEKASHKPVGMVAAVINANSTGWISFFIIDEKFRGRGLGRELFRSAEKDLERRGTKMIGLDSVAEQRSTYERRRFVASPLGTVRIMTRPLVVKQSVPEIELPDGLRIIDIKEVPSHMLAEHDLKWTGFERPRQWTHEHLFSRPDVKGVAIMGPVDQLVAWAINCRCSGGIRIGPVYADNAVAAKAVLTAAMNLASPEAIEELPLPDEAMNDLSVSDISMKATLAAEVWVGNGDAVRVFEELGWNSAGVEFQRMWVDGDAPPEQSQDGCSYKGVYVTDAALG